MAEQVSLARCGGYDVEEVEAALRRALAPWGGMAAWVRAGQRVAIKPNLLRPAAPDAAATTHPTVVAATARLVREAGGEATILDSSGGPNAAAGRNAAADRTRRGPCTESQGDVAREA